MVDQELANSRLGQTVIVSPLVCKDLNCAWWSGRDKAQVRWRNVGTTSRLGAITAVRGRIPSSHILHTCSVKTHRIKRILSLRLRLCFPVMVSHSADCVKEVGYLQKLLFRDSYIPKTPHDIYNNYFNTHILLLSSLHLLEWLFFRVRYIKNIFLQYSPGLLEE